MVGPFKEPILMVVVSSDELEAGSEDTGLEEAGSEDAGSDDTGEGSEEAGVELPEPVWLQAKRTPDKAKRVNGKILLFFIWFLLSIPLKSGLTKPIIVRVAPICNRGDMKGDNVPFLLPLKWALIKS